MGKADLMNPSDESFFASKTMILVVITMACIIVLVIGAVVVKVIWHVDVFAEVTAGIAGLNGQSVQGTYRNIKTDTPARLGQPPITLPPPANPSDDSGRPF